VLFIDELHTLVGAAPRRPIDLNMLKPAWRAGNAVHRRHDLNEYRKYIEKGRRPGAPLPDDHGGRAVGGGDHPDHQGLRDRYEPPPRQHHGRRHRGRGPAVAPLYSGGSSRTRHRSHRRAGSRTRLRITPSAEIRNLDKEVERVKQEKEEAIKTQEFERAADLRDR